MEEISHLANGLENGYGMFKISNMEDRNDKFDIRVMPNAIDGGLSTGFAKCVFVRCALTTLKLKYINDLTRRTYKPTIKNSIFHGQAICSSI